MTKLDFIMLCGEFCIDVNLALENESIRQALKNKDAVKVRQLMESEF